MAKVAVLVPHQDMVEMVGALIGRYENIEAMCVEYVPSGRVEARARELERRGYDLIVARGLYAHLAKHAVKLPVVEIRIAAQELAELVVELKEALSEDRPRIAVVGFANMLCDTSRFGRLFGVELVQYPVSLDFDAEDGLAGDPSEALKEAVARAIADGSAAVIGGDVVCACAARAGVPHRFITSGGESLKGALDAAQGVCYAIDLQKANSAEMDAMLSHTFNGIMQVDRRGTVRRANRAMLKLMRAQSGEVLGKSAEALFPALSGEALASVLNEGKEVYALLVQVLGRQTVVNIVPVLLDSEITGAILTFQEGERLSDMDGELRRELFMKGYVARHRLDQIPAQSEAGRQALALAERIARYNAPVLLTGEWGSGKHIMAECIHNASAARSQAYIPLDCSAYDPETLDTMLFGNHTTRKDTPPCLAELAHEGTVYLAHVDALTQELQYKLLHLIRGSFIHNGSNRPSAVRVRIIAATDVNLMAMVARKDFRNDLYYALNVLGIHLEPLRRRQADILGWVDFYLNRWQTRYQRRVSLTQGAKRYLETYDWPGNLHQMESVCERIVLLAERRNVDEGFLMRQMEQIAPLALPGTDQVVVFRDRKAVQIAELLKKHKGNRQRVADELGVSKTTLWRYIKKYGIGEDFTY